MPMLRNPVLLLIVGIPLAAVLASVLTVAVALRQPSAELPEQYHWEGFRLDRDFARAERAAALDVRGTLTVRSDAALCRIELRSIAPPPAALELRLVHVTLPERDRRVALARRGGGYEGVCSELPAGPWRLELVDDAGTWSIRRRTNDLAGSVRLTAREEPSPP